MSDSNLSIAFIDLETSPIIGYTWSTWDTNVIEILSDWKIISFAVKWANSKDVEVYALPDFPLYQTDSNNDLQLVKKLWEVFDKADIICAHNGDKFDLRKATARFIHHGLPPPSPYRSFDTLKIARKVAAFSSNKLNNLSQDLGLGCKVKTGGFDLWKGCLDKDQKSWETMKRYNKQDVVLLEKVYNKLKSWANTHPNITLSLNQSYLCPVCGGKTEKRGFDYLKSYKVQLYHCLVKTCGKWSRGARVKIDADVLS